MHRHVADGNSFAPLHYLNDYSFEDTLYNDYFTLAFAAPSILRPKDKAKSDKKVRFNVTREQYGRVEKQLSYPSKGNFYESLPRTKVPYVPFEPED